MAKTRIFAIAALVASSLFELDGQAAQTLRIGTIAPRGSTWGKALAAWERVVAEKTHDEISLTVYYNAVQGDEQTMVSKMRTGELDGATLSAIGLSLVYRDVMVLQLPGVTNSWSLVDLVRNAVKDPIEAGFRAAGFDLVGWGDIGLVYQMSKGVAIRRPADLRGRRPVVWRNEPMAPLLFSLVGQVVPIPLDPMEILPALRAGTIDVVAAPALAAEQLQWTPYLDHINDQIVVGAVGGTLIRSSRLEAIPADTRDMLTELERRVESVESQRIRQLDGEARDRLMQRMTVVHSSDDDKVEWYRIFLKAVKQMRHGLFSSSLIDDVLAITGKG